MLHVAGTIIPAGVCHAFFKFGKCRKNDEGSCKFPHVADEGTSKSSGDEGKKGGGKGQGTGKGVRHNAQQDWTRPQNNAAEASDWKKDAWGDTKKDAWKEDAWKKDAWSASGDTKQEEANSTNKPAAVGFEGKRIHPSDKAKAAYTFEEFKAFAATPEEALKMWNASKAAEHSKAVQDQWSAWGAHNEPAAKKPRIEEHPNQQSMQQQQFAPPQQLQPFVSQQQQLQHQPFGAPQQQEAAPVDQGWQMPGQIDIAQQQMMHPDQIMQMQGGSSGWIRKASRSTPGVFYYWNEATGETSVEPPPPWELKASRSQPGVMYYWNAMTGQTSPDKPEQV